MKCPFLSIHGPEAQTKACPTDGRSIGDVLPKEAGKSAVSLAIGRHRKIRTERQTKKDRIVYQNAVPVCPIVRTTAILNQKWPETVRSIAQREYFRMMCSSRLVLGHGAAIHVFHSRPTQKEDEKFPASFGTPRENLDLPALACSLLPTPPPVPLSPLAPKHVPQRRTRESIVVRIVGVRSTSVVVVPPPEGLLMLLQPFLSNDAAALHRE